MRGDDVCPRAFFLVKTCYDAEQGGGELEGWIVAVVMALLWIREHRRNQALQAADAEYYSVSSQWALMSGAGGVPVEKKQEYLQKTIKVFKRIVVLDPSKENKAHLRWLEKYVDGYDPATAE